MGSFKIGDRVRLRVGRRHPEYRAGDTGTVAAVMPSESTSGQEVYQVRMDEGGAELLPVFYADELELVEQ
jgi:hypothetical protein